MNKFTIPLRNTSRTTESSIVVGVNLLDQVGLTISHINYSKAVIVTGSNIPARFIEQVRASIHLDTHVVQLSTGEENKNLKTVQKIWKTLHDFDCDRKTLIVNLGGGFITDVGGFAASVYLKGIHFLNIPTTLLGQVDAAIGGKIAINFAGVKNLIGSFQSPVMVISDIACLSTLPKRDFVSGFGEVLKHGLISDSEYFQFTTSKNPRDFTQKELIKIVARSSEIKTHIVTKDIKEIGPGRILKFGHTIGHAIEMSSQQLSNPTLHGEAVILGMIIETNISNLLGLLSKKERDLIEQRLFMIHLPAIVYALPFRSILKSLQAEKKYTNGIVQCTLLKNIGRAVVNMNVPDDIIINALQQTKSLFAKKTH